MEIRKGTKIIGHNNKAIIEFIFEKYIIYVFQGTLSQFDIVIKYKKDNTRIRTPKHIHWVVDCLMKMQGNEALTKALLAEINLCWKQCTPLGNNGFATIKALVEKEMNKIDVTKYVGLNDYGEYSVEFLYVLMILLAVQEKTNRADAYMFGKIIEELLEVDRDLFRILSTAGFGGRN